MRLSRWLVAALLLGGGSAARAEEAVLLASTQPGQVPGMVMNDADRLVLPAGASLTLLLRSGQLLRLRGPLETSLAQARPAQPGGGALALAAAFRLQGVDASVIGGARATATLRPRLPAMDVLVDGDRSGTWCLGLRDSLWLARPVHVAEEWALRRRGNRRGVAWPVGAGRIEWPADLPVEDGDRFELLADGVVRASYYFHRLPEAAEAAVVAHGMLAGCQAQFEGALLRLSRAVQAVE